MDITTKINERDKAGRIAPAGSETGFEKKNTRGSVVFVILGLLLLSVAAVLLYPRISKWIYAVHVSRIIDDYIQTVEKLTEEERAEIMEAAQTYNAELPEGTHFQPSQSELDEYSRQLDFTGTGMMGYIQIPKINVSLPVYHTADESVLETAVGHIPGSSLPVGGETCHTVLCGHRDLTAARLFRDLGELEIGDVFTLTVLDQTITYKVDQILVVLPRQIEALAIENGKNYCTLVTCHPHGSSAYRMLVRGKSG